MSAYLVCQYAAKFIRKLDKSPGLVYLGVEIPERVLTGGKESIAEHGMGNEKVKLKYAEDKFTSALELACKTASLQETMQVLNDQVSSSKRRVNALEHGKHTHRQIHPHTRYP